MVTDDVCTEHYHLTDFHMSMSFVILRYKALLINFCALCLDP